MNCLNWIIWILVFCYFLFSCKKESPVQEVNKYPDTIDTMVESFNRTVVSDTINLDASPGYNEAIRFLDSLCTGIQYSSFSQRPLLTGMEKGIISAYIGIPPEYIRRAEYSYELDSLSIVIKEFERAYQQIYFEKSQKGGGKETIYPEVRFSHYFKGMLHVDLIHFDECLTNKENYNSLFFLFTENHKIRMVISDYIHYD